MNTPKFERLAFGNMAIGMHFFDTVSGQNVRKVSDTHGEFLTGDAALKGQTAYFGLVDEFETKTPIGYQIADEGGANIQGDGNDPSCYHSFEILTRARVDEVIKSNPGAGLQPYAIYEGDIEEPVFLG